MSLHNRMWIDTHCHLDAAEFGAETSAIVQRAAQQRVGWIVIPAIEAANFDSVQALAHRHAGCVYALGIHPLYTPQAQASDLTTLRNTVSAALSDPRFVAIGEIGLDFFVPALRQPALREKQEYFYSEQLKLARDFNLPVLLHTRRAQDAALKYLRRITPLRGIAHAFNGSFQQAQQFIEQGFKLGFGGAMTFTRALQIRRLAAELPLDALVLETDAPDIAPAWLQRQRNSPEELPRIAAVLAELRGLPLDCLMPRITENSCAALPRLAKLACEKN